MWQLTIENVAGIRSGTATIEPGVNAIEASNWRGKSSLIASVGTVLGTATPLTEGEDHGRVELETEEKTLNTILSRQAGEVVREGDVLLEAKRDRVIAELFATLGERNEIRRAVREGDNLNELITRPLDLENIEDQIAELRQERDKIDRELERVEEAAAQLPGAQERVTRLESELSQLREEQNDLSDLEEADASLETARETLSKKRVARDRAASTVQRLEDQIGTLEEKLEEREAELEDIDVPDEFAVESDLEELREERAAVESEIDLLQTVYNANRRVLEEGRVSLLTEVERGIAGDDIACWVCGESAGREAYEDQLNSLSKAIADRRERSEDLRSRVEALETKYQEFADMQQRAGDLEDEIERLSTRLADRRGDLEAASDRLGTLTEEVEVLEDDVEDVDERLTDVQSEIKYKEAELEDAVDELESLEARVEQRKAIEATREELSEEIDDLRTRKERKRRETRQAFQDAMETVLTTFEPGFESARLTSDFELVVAREGREVGIDALSEGEVELLGIMAALAGYEAFDVAERVPVILLDGLGGLAAENLHRLITYLDGRAKYLVTTAYPEQGGYDWHTILPDEWTVVSDREALA